MEHFREQGPGNMPERWWLMPVLGLATLLVFGLGGYWLLVGVQERPFPEVLMVDLGAMVQSLIGIAIGSVMAIVAWTVLRTGRMTDMRIQYIDRIGPHVQRLGDRWFLSICAGVGEEIFFRGAIQYWLGVIPTAVLFVAIHGYLDPRKGSRLAYGALLTLFMIGFGVMARYWGLIAPVTAHIMFDVVLLEWMAREWRTRRSASNGG